MIFKMFHTNNRQNGMALILAIGFLAVLSILGAVVMRVSTLDLKNTAAFLPERRAFYIADSTVEYALNDELINSVNTDLTNWLIVDGKRTIDLMTSHGGDDKRIISLGQNKEELVEAKLTQVMLTGAKIPIQYDFITTLGDTAELYHLNVKSKASLGTTSNIEASIMKLNLIKDNRFDGTD